MLRNALVCCLLLLGAGSGFARTAGIHSMVVGERTLELVNAWQITFPADGEIGEAWISPDGKWVACMAIDKDEATGAIYQQLRVTSLEDNQTKVLFDSQINQPGGDPGVIDQWAFVPNMDSPAWSPDSKLLAVTLEHTYSNSSAAGEEEWLVIFTPRGQRKASFLIPKSGHTFGDVRWSPDSSKIAGVYSSYQQRPVHYKVGVFDVARGSLNTLIDIAEQNVRMVGWSKDGESVHYTVRKRGQPVEFRELSLKGGAEKVLSSDYKELKRSPDGKLALAEGQKGVAIRDLNTDGTTIVIKSPECRFDRWTSSPTMFTFRRQETISDDTNSRRNRMSSIWLASTETHKLNHLCVAIDAEPHISPTVSADCTRIAYISKGRLYVAELAWRLPNMAEKLALGRPLTPEEQEELKQELLSAGKQIALAALMYANDYGESFPVSASTNPDLLRYLPDPGLFNLPGTDQGVYEQRYEGNLRDIDEPAETIFGVIDAGYGWQIILYADGHCVVVNK